MLLARTAGSLYWAARYLERAASTARIIREHTNSLIDLPVATESSWESLLAVGGTTAGYQAVHSDRSELQIIRWLLCDPSNLASVLSALVAARENFRSTREIVPSQLWLAMNDLHRFALDNVASGVDRAGRAQLCDQLVKDVQLCWGIVEDSMRRDEANAILAIGRYVERADMVTRVIDVRASMLLGEPDRASADLQWAGVLRSLSALQMYQRTMNGPVEGTSVIRFLLGDPAFPRSARHNIEQLERIVATLPRSDRPRQACAHARAVLSSRWADLSGEDPALLRSALDTMQIAIAAVSDAVVATYVQAME